MSEQRKWMRALKWCGHFYSVFGLDEFFKRTVWSLFLAGVLGFVAGAATGALTGILFAPEKGARTRKKLTKQVKRTSRDVTETIGDKVDEVKDKLDDVVSEMREKTEDAGSKVKEKVNARAKASGVS